MRGRGGWNGFLKLRAGYEDTVERWLDGKAILKHDPSKKNRYSQSVGATLGSGV